MTHFFVSHTKILELVDLARIRRVRGTCNHAGFSHYIRSFNDQTDP